MSAVSLNLSLVQSFELGFERQNIRIIVFQLTIPSSHHIAFIVLSRTSRPIHKYMNMMNEISFMK